MFQNLARAAFILSLQTLAGGVSAPAFAFEKTIAEICHDMHQPRTHSESAVQPKMDFKTRFGLRFWPSDFIQVKTMPGPTDVQSDPKTPTIIFGQGVTDQVLPSNAELRKQYEELYTDMLSIQRSVLALEKTATESDCLAKAAKIQLTDAQILIYGNAVEQIRRDAILFQVNNFNEAIRNAAKKFPLGRIVMAANTDEIRNIILKLPPGKYNFVFVLHSDVSGRLYDFSGFVLEHEFLSQIATKTASLGLFSCFPEAVASYYQEPLSQLLSQGAQVFLPQLKGEMATLDETPLILLPEFARQEQQLLNSKKQ